jgi:RNA polymerase sigma-70 factor, ECF subfamily
MGALTAISGNVVTPAGSTRRARATVRRERPRKIHSRAWLEPNPSKPIAAAVTNDSTSKDWAVVQRALAVDLAAQGNLLARHRDKLYRTAFSLLRSKEDAEDAVQDALCKAFTRLRTFQGRSSFLTWLTRIVINAALMVRRRNSAHLESSLDQILESQQEQLIHVPVDARPDPEEVCAQHEIHALVESRVRQLPADLQSAFRLRAEQSLSGRESSLVLGIPSGALKSRIYRARRKLANELQRSLASVTRA